jgi:hypothetical protein
LVDPATAATVATIRYEHATGFYVLSSGTTTPFSQWNGTPLNNLIFQNVQFGNRAVAFPQTDTSTWVNRAAPVANALFRRKHVVTPALLDAYIKNGTVPAIVDPSHALSDTMNQMNIEIQLMRARAYQEPGRQQAAIAAAAGAGALAGVGQGIGNYMTAQQDRDFKKSMQDRKYQLELENYGKYREIDMRVRQQMAGSLAPINQYPRLGNNAITPSTWSGGAAARPSNGAPQRLAITQGSNVWGGPVDRF